MSRKSSSRGHWKNPQRLKLDPEEGFGFVYLIVNLLTGRRYIGKKQYHRYRKGKKAAPSDWKTYTSSSRPLNKDLKSLGKKNFHFEILAEFQTRGGLVYGETHLQHFCDVLTARDENSPEDERLFYNSYIDRIRFIPQEVLEDATKEKIRSRVYQDFN